MKTIYEIQDEYARELGWNSMSDMLVNADGTRESLNRDYIEIATRYTFEAIKADREMIKQELDKVHATHEEEWGERYMASDLIDNLPIVLK